MEQLDRIAQVREFSPQFRRKLGTLAVRMEMADSSQGSALLSLLGTLSENESVRQYASDEIRWLIETDYTDEVITSLSSIPTSKSYEEVWKTIAREARLPKLHAHPGFTDFLLMRLEYDFKRNADPQSFALVCNALDTALEAPSAPQTISELTTKPESAYAVIQYLMDKSTEMANPDLRYPLDEYTRTLGPMISLLAKLVQRLPEDGQRSATMEELQRFLAQIGQTVDHHALEILTRSLTTLHTQANLSRPDDFSPRSD
jgi:hypothetical protein